MTTSSNDILFPIKNQSACVFKWGWNTFRAFNGMSSSCHRVAPVKVDIDNFQDFHNTPAVLHDRKMMLQGQWPQHRGCEYCQKIEENGGLSDRLYHNEIPGLTPIDFNYDVYATPSISEIYLTNTCDLACVYCLPQFSSRNNQELKNHGPYPIGIQSVTEHPQRDRYVQEYCNWLKNNVSKLKRISILGGEPLIQKEFYQILQILENTQNPNLELSVNTNLNAEPKIIERFISIAKNLTLKKHIKQLHVSASLDCWGPQAEFVRHGLSLTRWLDNFKKFCHNRWIALSIHQVITALTIKTAQQLQDKITELKSSYPKIVQEYYLVDSGYEKIYHPEIFGNEFFAQNLSELLDTFPISREWDTNSRKRLEGIVKLISSSSPDRDRLIMLKNTLDQIDLRRNTDWKSLWPEINLYFVENNI